MQTLREPRLRTIWSIGVLGGFLVGVQSIQAQDADATPRHAWIAAGAGGGSLGPSAEASLWLTGDRVAVGARWSQTVVSGYGSGDKNELTVLVGMPIPVWRSTMVAAAGLARAGGCYTVNENERCAPLGIEAAPAWALELDAPVARHVGIHVAGLGVEGRRTRYVGLSAGLSVGAFP
jgi:hypothetical protein